MIPELVQQLHDANSLPFLFIGSGFSKRYLNLPSWEELLISMSNLVSSDKYYYAKIEKQVEKKYSKSKHYNEYMTAICDIISDDLVNLWYESEDFELSRGEFANLIYAPGFHPIKAEVAKLISSKTSIIPNMEPEYKELSKITSNSIAGIITTNYDTLLEKTFNFDTYLSQDQLMFNVNYEIGEIYKIHGCVSSPNTIMITSNDYVQIQKKNQYIAAKLLTIFVEHPIIFIGYSMNDQDIRTILEAISECLNTEQRIALQKRLIFIDWDPSIKIPQYGSFDIAFPNGNNITMTKYSMSSFTDLYKTIGKHKTNIPVKALRKLKHAMYELALTTDSSSKIEVLEPEKIINSDQFEIIAGFGIINLSKRGYRSIQPIEIFTDVLLDTEDFNYSQLVKETLPSLGKNVNWSIPMFKYIKDVDTIPDVIKNKIEEIKDASYFVPNTLKRRIHNSNQSTLSLSDILSKYPDYKSQLSIIPTIYQNIDPHELKSYLINLLKEHPKIFEEKAPIPSNFRRLIKLYDYLEYRK